MDTALLARAAQHEAGHCLAALCFLLPLLEVVIRDDGSGKTSYCRHFGVAEARSWVITTFAGGAAEFDLFGDHHGDRSDLIAIANMLDRLHLTWSESRLAELRQVARWLVKRERARIRLVADALIKHRRLSAFDVRWLKACSVPIGSLT
jgi:hypothetical protein